MAEATQRIQCFIDVLDRERQRALVRKDVLPEELVKAVIDEFSSEIVYLGKNTDAYSICLRETGRELDPKAVLDEQIGDDAQLALTEKEGSIPKGATALPVPFYLREQSQGFVYKIRWLPAIIGRFDPNENESELVAVDLQNTPNGMRVSRRHVRMLIRDGVVYLELQSRNPASLIRTDGNRENLEGQLLAFRHGDILKLDRSGVTLQALFQTEPTEHDD